MFRRKRPKYQIEVNPFFGNEVSLSLRKWDWLIQKYTLISVKGAPTTQYMIYMNKEDVTQEFIDDVIRQRTLPFEHDVNPSGTTYRYGSVNNV